MKRHIRTKHPYVYEQEMNELGGMGIETVDTAVSENEEYLDEYTKDVKKSLKNKSEQRREDENLNHDEADSESELVESETVFNESDPHFEEKIKYFCTKPVTGKSKYQLHHHHRYQLIIL